jgi:hypothetical protein
MRLSDRIATQNLELRLDEINRRNKTTGKLATPVHINGVEFDGSKDITIASTSTGSNLIGGFPTNVTQADHDDLLIFNGNTSAWVDINKTEILDGGNF